MYLTDAQIKKYETEGFIALDDFFTEEEMQIIERESTRSLQTPSPGSVLEKGTQVVRAINGPHLTNQFMQKLMRFSRLLGPAMQLIKTPVYLHQFKINAKYAFSGEQWEWHQDFTFWSREDGMPAPMAVTVAISLNDVNEFNGPLMFIPKSHQLGSTEVETRSSNNGDWTENFSSYLKYQFDRKLIKGLVEKHGMVAPKLKKGSVLFFHPNVFHCSSSNMSPFDRNMLYITYNSTSNTLPEVQQPRPEFLVGRDFTPLTPTQESLLAG